jgi:hypothetical protein
MPPAPKINPVRRNSRVGPLQLPAEGRKGAPPAWPLDGKPNPQIQRIWRQLWATPQAVAWERLGWTRVVARYARVALAAEVLDKDALAEARHLEDRLGLTPKAMRTLLWEIVADEVKQHRESSDVRRRIKAV